jgi:hypothetical protein
MRRAKTDEALVAQAHDRDRSGMVADVPWGWIFQAGVGILDQAQVRTNRRLRGGHR